MEKGIKGYFLIFLILLIIITDLVILLDILFLRQIIGFLFITLLPGLLILHVLKLDKIGSTEKFVLSVGLSVSFMMLFGLLVSNVSLLLGYLTPLAEIPLLVVFNISFIVLAVIGYRLNKEPFFSITKLNLSTEEKAFLIIPVLFPALSIFGVHIMNTSDNNIILMILLCLIPIYVIFVCVFNQKFPRRLYPVVIYLIGISLLLLMALRSSHLIGADVHGEFKLFLMTAKRMHWSIPEHPGLLDACLCDSILPTLYNSILNINPEFLFKILYSILYSITPLAVYVIARRYIGDLYGFLTSCFFMFQSFFMWIEAHPRTSISILFFTLAIMALFNNRITPLKKKALFIIFMVSCLVSHYSTTYIFFFILFGSFIGLMILPKKYTFKKEISLTTICLFFALIFFWYSQVIVRPFYQGVWFISETFTELNNFFIMESRAESVSGLAGVEITEWGIPQQIEWVFTWLIFAFICIGLFTAIMRFKDISLSELKYKMPDFLKDKFEVGFLAVALACAGVLVLTVIFPYIAKGYSMQRAYGLVITILSLFFVIGGISLFNFARYLKKWIDSKRKESKVNRVFLSKEQFNENDASQTRAYIIILLVLIPYFLSVTGVTYQLCGYPQQIILNSKGFSHDTYYVHDQDSCAAKWLGRYNAEEQMVYPADNFGSFVLNNWGVNLKGLVDGKMAFSKRENINGYIYLRYCNVVNGQLMKPIYGSITEYSDMFIEKNRIYNNGGSEVWG